MMMLSKSSMEQRQSKHYVSWHVGYGDAFQESHGAATKGVRPIGL